MNKAESLYDVLRRVIDRNRDEYTDELGWEECSDGDIILDFDPLGNMPIDDSLWVLRGATDDEAKTILRDFIGSKTSCGWSLSCQMAQEYSTTRCRSKECLILYSFKDLR